MIKLKAAEVRELGLDPKRAWVRVKDSKRHELVVENHDGGSVAECPQCGERVAYGDGE